MKKKQTATKCGAAEMAATLKENFLNALNYVSGYGVGKREILDRLLHLLPKLGDVGTIDETTKQRAAENGIGEITLKNARNFLSGKYSKFQLNLIGVETLYKILLRFYAELNAEKTLDGFYEYFSVWNCPDLRAVLAARKQHGRVNVCGEGVDVAVKLWELEDSLSFARDERERAEVQQKIDTYKTRLRSLGEEIYETLKRGERRAAAAGSVALKMFNATKDAALKLGAPDMMQIQRERAAQWLIKECAEGRKASIVDAAQHFGNEIEAEIAQGGYGSVENLRSKLYDHAAELGISKYIKRRGKQKKG